MLAERRFVDLSDRTDGPHGKEVNMSTLNRLVAIYDRFRRTEDGQGLAEYALILALIAIVAIVALIFLGSQVSDKLHIIGTTLQSYQP
jgi:pilus assembly protein Flp/PilA